MQFRLSHILIALTAVAVGSSIYLIVPPLASSNRSFIRRQEVRNKEYVKGWHQSDDSHIFVSCRMGSGTTSIREEEGKGIWVDNRLVRYEPEKITIVVIDGVATDINYAQKQKLSFFIREFERSPHDMFTSLSKLFEEK